MPASRRTLTALVVFFLAACSKIATPDAGVAANPGRLPMAGWERFARIWPLVASPQVLVSSIEDRGGGLTVRGHAASFDDVSEFMRALHNIALHSSGPARVVERSRDGTWRLELLDGGQIVECRADRCGLVISEQDLKSTVLAPDGGVAFGLDITLNAP